MQRDLICGGKLVLHVVVSLTDDIQNGAPEDGMELLNLTADKAITPMRDIWEEQVVNVCRSP